jgi:hypothetical protein
MRCGTAHKQTVNGFAPPETALGKRSPQLNAVFVPPNNVDGTHTILPNR